MKRLLAATALISLFVGCSSYEEYTPPSPIEIRPRTTKPEIFDQESFGDEGLSGIDAEEKTDDFDPRLDQQKEIQDDIATLERKKRAKKLTSTEVKNITIKRKTVASAPKPVVKEEASVVAKPEPIKEAAPKKLEADLNLEDDLDIED